jgi:hypothetical protein
LKEEGNNKKSYDQLSMASSMGKQTENYSELDEDDEWTAI